MDAVLNQLNAVPGVIGSLVCDGNGIVVARAFPKAFDHADLENAARVLTDGVLGCEATVGAPRMLDFRFAETRVLAKPFRQEGGKMGLLILLCAKEVSTALLGIVTDTAIKKFGTAKRSPGAAPTVTGSAPLDGVGTASPRADVYSDAELLRKMLMQVK